MKLKFYRIIAAAVLFLTASTVKAQVITPVWATATSGTLNGIPFTITGFETNPFLSYWDYTGTEFSCAPLGTNEASLDYAGSSNLTITFASPVADFKLYMRWWRTDIYTIDHPYVLMCGQSFVTSNDTIQVDSTWGNGILDIQDSVTTITITSDQSCCSHQVLLFGSGDPLQTGTTDLMKPQVSFSPNPVTETLFMSHSGDVMITDVLGKVVLTALNTRSVDMSNLPGGVYYVSFSSADMGSTRTKVVKTR